MDRKTYVMAMVLISGLALAGCGSSSSGGGPAPGAGAGAGAGGGGNGGGVKSTGAVTASIQNALGGMTVGLGGLSATGKPTVVPFEKIKASDLRSSLTPFLETVQQIQNKTVSPLATDISEICTSGSASFDPDLLTSGFIINYDNCVTSDKSTQTTLNLDMSLTPPSPFPSGMCGFDAYTFVLDGTVTTVGPDVDEIVTFVNYTMDMSFSNFDADCIPSDISIALDNGLSDNGLSLTDNIDSSNSFSMTIDSLTIQSTMVTGGQQLSVNGTITMDADCFSGEVTTTTTTDMFIPDGARCPTDGVVEVSGAVSGTATYTSTGGVDIDEGSDGTVDISYDSCEEAEACT